MQSMLTERANALKAGKFDKAKEIQQKMTEYKNDDDNFKKLTTPRLFYCTFHTEYAYRKAIEFSKFEFMGLKDDLIGIKQASEATDIAWESRHISRNSRRLRWTLIMFTMVILSLGAFTFIFWLLKRKLLVDYSISPPGIECDTVTRNIENPIVELSLR